jgi:hypothetical protein
VFEVVQIGGPELAQRAARLDQQPRGHEPGLAARDLGHEAELAGRGQVLLHVAVEWADRQLAPERDEGALEQVVVAGPQVAVQHQEHKQLPGARIGAQPDLERLGRPGLRLGPAGQKPLSGVAVATVILAAGRL